MVRGNADAGTIPQFVLGTTGCPMAHCSPHEDDYNAVLAPPSIASMWRDRSVVGSAIGLGCASNGTTAVCSVVNTSSSPAIVAYDAAGKHLWDSKSLIDSTAFASAPMVDTDGGAIAADDKTVIRFDSAGNVIWQQATAGGTPISPVPLPNGLVVLATKAEGAVAPISTFDATTGTPGPTIQLTDVDDSGSYIWGTVNTPSSEGNRLYVSMARTPVGGGSDKMNKGALFALDLSTTAITVAWSFVFEGPSASSPMATMNGVYFDGAGVTPDGSRQTPVFFGLHDAGATWQLMWTHEMESQPNCNAAHDPRGGVWTFGSSDNYMVRLDETAVPGCTDGTCEPVQLQELDFPRLFRDPKASPIPTISLASTATSSPQMIIGAKLSDASPVTDIDLVTGTVAWQYDVGGPTSVGQYPVLTDATGRSVIVYTTIAGGTFGLVGAK